LAAVLFDLCAKRAAIVGTLRLLLGAWPMLAAGNLAAQSSTTDHQPAPVVRQVEESAQATKLAGDPAPPTQAGQTGTPGLAPFTRLKEALAAAQATLAELSKAAEAAASVRQLRRELQAAHEANQLLTFDLATLRESRRELQSSNEAARERVAKMTAAAQAAAVEVGRLSDEIDGLRGGNAKLSAALAFQEKALSKITERTTAELAALRKQLEANEQEVAGASAGRQQTEARLEELQRAIFKFEQEAAGRREEIVKAQDALASAERELEEAKVRIDQLWSRVVTAEEQVRELEATDASLGADLQAFTTAANSAADVVRQDLKPVESQVAALPEQSGLRSDPASAGGPGVFSLDQLTANLPPKKKQQIQALLTDLKPEIDQRGLLIRVSGGGLFRANSDEIAQTAYHTLAKLAELINGYDGRQVLIVGHTDASGETAYNQMLSKRRADQVRQFFIDNFDIDAARLITEGKGEDAPIASNRTYDGREANRRVEVLLLN
jgi:outer membrane protein OmpA-like peptidoglycan-associated protein